MEILKKYGIALAVLMSVMGACVKKATIKLPPPESKLVITSFISPGDSIILVAVKSSVSEINSMGPTYYPQSLDNAQVILQSTTQTLVIPFNPDFGSYRISASKFNIAAGNTYTLSVSTPDGNYANASTTVPAELLSVSDFEVNASTKDSINYNFDASVNVGDADGITNYVMTYFECQSVGVPYYSSDPNQIDTITGNTYGPFYDNDERLKKAFYHFSYTGTFASLVAHASENNVVVHALNCSKAFYLYNQSVGRAQNLGQGNPFAEPVLIYTNVNNGFGCFGAYNERKFKKRIN